MKTVVLATNNKGKLEDFKNALGNKFEVKTLAEMGITIDPEETGNTYEENALIKAKAIHTELTNKGIQAIVVADDSGLDVDALPGKLGVYTARYSGDTDKETKDTSNNTLLLQEMKCVENRDARYTCVLCLITEDGKVSYFKDTMEVQVACKERKGTGFAYDSILVSKEYNKYVSALTNEERTQISHRGKAIKRLSTYLDVLEKRK